MFKIPPMSNPSGHLFGSWKENIWTGNIKITAVGETCTVKFITFEGQEYAKAIIADNFKDSVQKVVDSSRGYAIKLTSDDGRSMWVGIGFHDRNDAFDFYAAFEDFQKKREMERNPHLFKNQNKQSIDFRLGPGQNIMLNIGAEGTNQVTNPTDSLWENPFDKKTTSASSGGFGDFDFGLPDADRQQGSSPGGFDENNWEKALPKGRVDLLGDASTGQRKPQSQGTGNSNGNSQGNGSASDWFSGNQGQRTQSHTSGSTTTQPVPPQQPKKDDFLDLLG
jgi:hypothetical protein